MILGKINIQKKSFFSLMSVLIFLTSNFFFLTSFLLCLIPALLTSSCTRDRNHPGYNYMNDMAQSEAYEYYSENPNFANGGTAQMTVKGSISRGFIPYSYPKTLDGQVLAGKELLCPIKDTQENIDTGKVRFNTYCAMCHGESGKGNGHLVTSKKFKKDVTSLVSDFVQKKPDGELFHVITLGSVSGFMGSHSSQLKPEDRWRIVRYIKTKLKGTLNMKLETSNIKH